MFAPTADKTRAELRQESDALLAARLRIVFALQLVGLTLFAAADALALMPSPNPVAYSLYALQFVVTLAGLAALRGPRAAERAVTLAVLVTASVCVTTAALGVVTNDVKTAPLVYIVLSMSTATLFPWGVAPQITTVAVAAAAYLWNVEAGAGLSAALDYPVVAMLIAFASSIYIALEFDRYRLAIEHRNLELRGYRDVVENANDAILTFDLDLRMTGVNRGAEAMLGYPRAELVGRPAETIFLVEDPQAFRVQWVNALRGDPLGAIFSLEARRQDGQTVPLEVKARPIGGDKAPVGMQAIMRDVTVKKVVEQMRNDFVAMLSHDIKTPLSAILGFVSMLRDQVVLTTEVENLLDRVEANVQVALTLAVNFVDVSRIESGPLELNLESANLNDIIHHVLRHQESIARAREISLEASLASDLPRLRLDRRQIDRVVANLVNNAIKFSPTRSRVRVETLRRDGRVVLSVRDQGPGISAKDRPNVFQRYQRFGRQRPDGSGLGLFIVKTIVEAHGGHVGLDCPAEGGATFEVSFEDSAAAA